MKRLRIPVALAFAIAGSTAIVGGLAATTSCDSNGDPPDAQAGCMLYCVSDGTDAGVCPSPPGCADAGICPAGCQPIG